MLVRMALGAATVVVGFLGGVQLHQVVASPGDPGATYRAIDPKAHESTGTARSSSRTARRCLARSPTRSTRTG